MEVSRALGQKKYADCVDAVRDFWHYQGGQYHGWYGRIGKTHRVTGMNYVYILRCADDTLYCGWTTDLNKRLASHNSGRGAKYTRSRQPVERSNTKIATMPSVGNGTSSG